MPHHLLSRASGESPPKPVRFSYTKKMLSGRAGACSAWLRSGRDGHVDFDNDAQAHAPRDARALKEMLEAS